VIYDAHLPAPFPTHRSPSWALVTVLSLYLKRDKVVFRMGEKAKMPKINCFVLPDQCEIVSGIYDGVLFSRHSCFLKPSDDKASASLLHHGRAAAAQPSERHPPRLPGGHPRYG
jgi:hypothetical protein